MKSQQSFRQERKGATEADAHIRSAVKRKLDHLDLSNLQLKKIPLGLSELTRLKSLNLSGNELSLVPEHLTKLTQLRVLYLANNLLKELPFSFSRMHQLEFLELSSNDLVGIPEWISNLKQLRVLHLSGNRITSLPNAICDLEQLNALYLSSNQLSVLPEALSKIKLLQALHLSDNHLTNLPSSIRELTLLSELRLNGNVALGLPQELSETKTEALINDAKSISSTAILDYYFRTREDRRQLNEVKLIFVGRGGVGKTSIVARIINNTYNPHEVETTGINIQPWQVQVSDGNTVRVHLWDFGGQEILHGTHQFFLTDRSVYLLVLSGRENNAMQDAEYWLQLIRSFGGESKVIIALNKVTTHPFDINRQLLREKYPSLVDFVATDCSGDGIGIAELRKSIVSVIDSMEHRKVFFPSDWFSIKDRLAAMQDNYITWDKYQEICTSFGEGNPNSQRLLADFLHNLGVALHYSDDPRLRDTRILNPSWVTEGIYNIIRVGQQKNIAGVLKFDDLANTLNSKIYPSSKCDFLLSLMERFQLCFRLSTNSSDYLIPELLSDNQPDISSLLDKPGLGFRYQYEMLPHGLLSRFIVQTRLLSEANPEWRWRTGVILEKDGCGAIVRADERERRVDIHIIGSSDVRRRELLAVIRAKFEEQHRDLKGLFIDERVPIPNHRGLTVSYRHLIQLEEEGISEFRPEGFRASVSISDLLGGIEDLRGNLTHKARSLYLLKQLNSTIRTLKQRT